MGLGARLSLDSQDKTCLFLPCEAVLWLRSPQFLAKIGFRLDVENINIILFIFNIILFIISR